MRPVQINAPYLLFLGDETRATYVKTAQGLVDWVGDKCAGQYRLTAQTTDLQLPDLSIAQAQELGVKSLLIGTAQIGGGIPDNWMPVLIEALENGLDIVAGLHTRLSSVPSLVAAAKSSGARLVDLRQPPNDIPIGNGRKRSGMRLLTVGTDCALGKKYTALSLTKAMTQHGLNTTFRATGQTGMMIAGEGIAIDAVVTDFISGAAELISPDNDASHWDVIEGQGAIFHPGYGSVSHGLLVGSQPDAFVVCSDATRTHISGWPDYPLPSIADVIEHTVRIGQLTNPQIRCVGISVNTQALTGHERESFLANLAAEHQLPCVDPLVTGCAPIIAEIERQF